MINWHEKFIAFALHFLATLVVAACAAALIYWVWYPEPFDEMMGGTRLFLLIAGCDLALGPLISLIIYNSRKSRGKLIFDYIVIGIIQLGSFAYGVFVISAARPVYVAFVGDRFDVVAAGEIPHDELAAAIDPQYRSLPLSGPRVVAVHVPAEDQQDALFRGLDGVDVSMRPRFFVPLAQSLPDIQRRARTLEVLERKFPGARQQIAAAATAAGIPSAQLRWLPVRHPSGFWTVLVDYQTGYPLVYFALDPY